MEKPEPQGNTELQTSPFYVTGGTVPPNSPSYIPRRADKELFDALQKGELCYVLNARQMGKSSLCARTRQALQSQGIHTAFLDLQKFGSSATSEQWYRSLLERLGHDFKLRSQFLAFWRDNADRAPLDRLFGALGEVALEKLEGSIVVFLDEIDVVRDFAFKTDEFFGAIRQCHNARVDDPVYSRLTFCIIGTVAPTDLIRDVRLSPFNIGTRIKLLDFTPTEVAPLAAPLPGGMATLTKVLSWTSGHPYLTQRLCAELVSTGSSDVDSAVARLFFAKSDADVDENVKNVRNAILRGGDLGVDRTDLLIRYGQIIGGKRVPDDDTDAICTALRLSGLVRSEGGLLQPRCRIYAKLFDTAWVKDNLPDAELRRQKAAVAKARWQIGSIAAAVMIAMTCLTTWALTERTKALASAAAERKATTQAAQREKDAIASAMAESKAKTEAQVERTKAQAERTKALTLAQSEGKAKQAALAATTKAESALKGESVAKATALHSAKLAQEQARRANIQTGIAQTNADTANRLAYITNSNLAQAAIENNNYGLAQQYLDAMNALLKSPHMEAGFEWTYLNELMHQELLQFKGHIKGVSSVAFSSDGKRTLTGSWDGTARVWDTATGRETLQLKGHTSGVTSVAFSPDGRRILTGSDDSTARLWDASTGRELLQLKGHRDHINSVAFSPDGNRILTGSGRFARNDDSTARLWDASTGKELLQLKGHTRNITSVAFSPDGKEVLTGSDDSSIRIWDTLTGKELRNIRGNMLIIKSASFSSDGKRILTGSIDFDDTMIRLWDALTCKELLKIKTNSHFITSLALSPNGKNILTSSTDTNSNDKTVRLLEVATGKELLQLKGHTGNITSVAFSPDGNRILTGSADGTARLWDAKIDRTVLQLRGHASHVSSVAFSPDGKKILTGGSYFGVNGDNTARVWDISTGKELRQFKGHKYSINSAVFSPDGKNILIGSGGIEKNDDISARIWDVSTGIELLKLKGLKDCVNSVAFSPDGKRILTGSGDGTARLWDVSTGRELRQLKKHISSVHYVAFSPDGKQILTGNGLLFHLWDVSTGRELLQLKGHTFAVISAAFSPDGKRILTGSDESNARLWDASTGRELLQLKGHNNGVYSIAFSPDGKRIVTGSGDGTARVWDASTGREVLQLKGHRNTVYSVAFSPDGNRILTGSQDGTARVWRKITDAQAAELERQATALEREAERERVTKAEQAKQFSQAEKSFRAGDLASAHQNFAALARSLPSSTNAWAASMSGLIVSDTSTYRNTTIQQLRAVNEKTTATQTVTIARRAAIVPKLFEDYAPYIALGKQAADEADKRVAKPADGDDLIFYSYGTILLRAGKTDEAIVQLERAAKLKPDHVFSMQFLALAYAQRGDKATARQWFDKSEAWMRTEMDKEFPGPANWAARLQVLLLWQECKQALGMP